MRLRVLGAHNMESRDTRMESHLLDGVLALDAGGLTRSLTFDEQRLIRAVVLSHRHFDHIRDLLPLGLALLNQGVTIEVYAIEDTAEALRTKLLDGAIYPDFLRSPSPEQPVFRLNVVDFHSEFQVLDYRVTAVPVPHSVPAAGLQVSKGDSTLFYTGDAGKGLSDAWKHVSPKVLLTEVTFGNDGEDRAHAAGHLTPKLLGEALEDFHRERGYLPKVLVSHINPPWEEAIRREVTELAKRMDLDLTVAEADMSLDL